ncbi:PREDICTED: uncharacterized protein LOC109153351 isoform X2 [Ipomoea nil]|uniref:uncharacterized protein LOC109153351 isoform X2 n=1 Tax=Ipomoea nil TaxID=35883 RepID=UPI000901380A|nr:PREDICTED: uncharacterized protein LOC109153351 isoform X2 [Ipomoea nil]
MTTPLLSPTTFNGFLSSNHNLKTSKNNVCQRFGGALHLRLSTPRTSKQLQSNFRIARHGWILGILISVILPLLYRKRGSLMQLKNRAEKALYTVEEIVDRVERTAEVVDKVAGNVAEDLSAGKFRETVRSIENVAEKVDKSAEALGDFIDKVQEVNDKVKLSEEIGEKEADKPSKVERD